ncbi:MAG: glycosyltransferase family 1 protein [Calditrichales bacterium]|nr:MAG: glycosyltransferase family 1 protein [Calditrichales bacterium]
MKNKYKIAIIGSYPPPYGGISVHVQRMLARLDKEKFVFFNTAKSSYEGSRPFWGKHKFIQSFLFIFKPYRLIHYHTPDDVARVLLSFVGYFRKNIYLHIHGESLEQTLNRKSPLAFIQKILLHNVHILASNSRIVQIVKPFNPRSIHEIDAFLPPLFDAEMYEKIRRLIPDTNSDLTISMVGWFRSYLDTDVYGYDIALEALHILQDDYKINVTIIASVNGINDQKLFQKFQERRRELELEESFLLIMDDLDEVWPLYLKSDIFIRPTNTDGGAVSIKEAQWFDAEVIASDAVPRPQGISLFKNRDAKDLASQIFRVSQQKYANADMRIQKARTNNFTSKLLEEIYHIEE